MSDTQQQNESWQTRIWNKLAAWDEAFSGDSTTGSDTCVTLLEREVITLKREVILSPGNDHASRGRRAGA